jgi:type III secretion system YscQ/HrcQ family protein
MLPHVSHGASERLTRLRASLVPPSCLSRVLQSLRDLTGERLEVTSDSAGRDLASTLTHNTISLRLSGPVAVDAAAPWWVVLEVELALVVALVCHVTKRPAVKIVHPGVATPTMLGAFAAILASAVRRGGVPVIVSDVGSASATAETSVDVTVAGLTVAMLDQSTHVRAIFPSALLPSEPPHLDSSALAALESLPLELPIIACRTLATAAEVASLAVGDAWMLDDVWPLGSPGGPLRGPVMLCAGSGERALSATLEGDGRVVLRDGVEELGWSPMNDEADENAALTEAVGEVPVVVRVEIGAARMTAKEWSALKPGDVVGVGTKVGALVTLRVSGLAVAEGELVEIDGEVGVRIRRRLSGRSA